MITILQSQSVAPPWLIETGLPLLVAMIGAFMGFVFVVASWRGSAAANMDFRKDPRIKGFLYGLGVFLTTLIGDWKSLLGRDVNKTQLLVLYGFPFSVVGFGGVFLIALAIGIELVRSKESSEEFRGRRFHLVLDYVTYGYRYYREEYDRILEAARKNQQQNSVERVRRLSADAATNLAALILSPMTSVQDVLQSMCLTLKARSSGLKAPEVNANLMIAVPFNEATAEQKRHLKFAFGDQNRYGQLLALTEYAYDKGEERITLPVENPILKPDWTDWTLFGAPEAFLRSSETVVNTKKLDFARRVPKNIRGEMKQYFSGKGFKSFKSLTSLGKGSVIGIVNIESNQEFGSDEVQNEVAKTMQPFCAVLSQIIQREIR